MTERGMIFNELMVKAILAGRKSQTRRPVKFPIKDKNIGCDLAGNELAGELAAGNYTNSAFGKPGDRIYVRETWSVITHDFDEDGLMIPYSPDRPTKLVSEMKFGKGYYTGHVVYAADGSIEWGDDDGCVDGRSCWKPSIHMPKAASRILLEITNVGVQRLQSISEGDAAREGLIQLPASGRYCLSEGDQYFGGVSRSAKEVYSWLWDNLYQEQDWKSNPWVWVIEFKKVEEEAK